MTAMKQDIDIMGKGTPRLKEWNLVPSMVSRIGKQTSQLTVVMTLESKPNSNHDILVSTIVSRSAKFQHRCWLIKDTAGHTRGFLSQPKDGYYVLERAESDGGLVEVLKIHYKFLGVFKFLTEKPTRKAEVSIQGGAQFLSKEPVGKDGKPKPLYTAGRGRVTSSKNMQLLSNEDGKMILQFVKWGDNQFHLDYKEPFDAFLAFGFAIAQLDLGMITLM
ncbi:unnamed protein product [Cylindrotheca closterium]|uniref:Tubby C-terminal domain-containing protein n=1 Tax=Cylindrotheca closterium TaxID=2856 RepID=A0AAD2FX88_9STRA|nr:unnamed protein product [Cylindrotheca closterium]